MERLELRVHLVLQQQAVVQVPLRQVELQVLQRHQVQVVLQDILEINIIQHQHQPLLLVMQGL